MVWHARIYNLYQYHICYFSLTAYIVMIDVRDIQFAIATICYLAIYPAKDVNILFDKMFWRGASQIMKTSWTGSTFCITGPLWGYPPVTDGFLTHNGPVIGDAHVTALWCALFLRCFPFLCFYLESLMQECGLYAQYWPGKPNWHNAIAIIWV